MILLAVIATAVALLVVLVLNLVAAVSYHRDPETRAARRALVINCRP